VSTRVPGREPPDPERGERGDADASEVLDLDTSFGLSAFGSERPDERDPAAPPGQPAPAAVSTSTPDRKPDAPVSWLLGTDDPPAAHGPSSPPLIREPYRPTTAVPALEPTPPPMRPMPEPGTGPPWIAFAGALALVLAIGAGVLWARRGPAGEIPAATGELTVQSTPGGARVFVAGKDRGATPLTLALAPGTYDLELRAGGERHMLPVRVKAGAVTAQHVFLQKTQAATGRLRITSEPPSAAVAVDGRGRGKTPVLITDLAAGPHDVVVTGTSGSVRQRVRVDPAATTTVMVPLPRNAPPPQSTGGWLSITASTELQVFEGDRLLGTTRVNRMMLPTGVYNLHLVNEAAGVDITRRVTIERGQTARLQVALPPGTLSINAVPWATVSVDGREVGETPLGAVELSAGPHVVVFSHPQLGQRRQEVTVRAGETTRVSVDLRR
jgi:hypothetical protein